MPPFSLLILVTAGFCLIFGQGLFRQPNKEKEVIDTVEESQFKQLTVQPAELKPIKETPTVSQSDASNLSDKTPTSIKPDQTDIQPSVALPKYTFVEIDPSNYGERYSKDIYGKSLTNKPLVVLHETVGSLTSAINTFKTPHSDENKQVSYHALIALDGTIVYLVPAEKRAFGAGNSAFVNVAGEIETVQTNHLLPSSVNNFAYHISLETPPDGRGNQPTHKGYTERQYHSLAWLLANSSIPDDRITTHQAVDRSGHRFDPRSFDRAYFVKLLHSYRH